MSTDTKREVIPPHKFEPGETRWCVACGGDKSTYAHAPAAERQEFDQAQAAQAADLERWRSNIAGRKAEIEERDYIVHALTGPGFILEHLATGPAPVSFRYFRDGRHVTVTIRVEQS